MTYGNTSRTRAAAAAAFAAGEMNPENIDDAEYILAHQREFSAEWITRAERTIAIHYGDPK